MGRHGRVDLGCWMVFYKLADCRAKGDKSMSDKWKAIRRGFGEGWYGKTWAGTKVRMDVVTILNVSLCLTVADILYGERTMIILWILALCFMVGMIGVALGQKGAGDE